MKYLLLPAIAVNAREREFEAMKAWHETADPSEILQACDFCNEWTPLDELDSGPHEHSFICRSCYEQFLLDKVYREQEDFDLFMLQQEEGQKGWDELVDDDLYPIELALPVITPIEVDLPAGFFPKQCPAYECSFCNLTPCGIRKADENYD